MSAAGLVAAELSDQSALLLSFPCRAVFRLLLFADETVHRFHACFSGRGAGACAGRRVAGGEGNFQLFPDGHGWRTLQYSAVLPLLLAVAVVFWLIGFDIIYALQDYEFDRRTACIRW